MPAKVAKASSSKAAIKSGAAETANPAEATKSAAAGEKGKGSPQDEAPIPDERKKSENKPSEQEPADKVAGPAVTEASVDNLATKVVDLQVSSAKQSGRKKSEKGEEAGNRVFESSKPTTEISKTDAKHKKGGKAGSDDPPKVAEPGKSSEVSKPKAETKTSEAVRIHAAGGNNIRILAICGSLRKASFNMSLLRMAQKTAPTNVEIVISDISGLPFFNQDTENEPNSAVAKFKAEIAAADAILFATPEYNYSIPGVLKNAIDVASRPWGQNSWANKPTGLWSASVGGFGGIRAQMALRQSAVFLKLNIYPGDEFLVSNAGGKFDADGLSDAETQAKLTAWISSFSKWVQGVPLIPLQ